MKTYIHAKWIKRAVVLFGALLFSAPGLIGAMFFCKSDIAIVFETIAILGPAIWIALAYSNNYLDHFILRYLGLPISLPVIKNLKADPKTDSEKIQDLEQNVIDLQQSISALKIIITVASIILFIIILGLIGADVFFLWLFSTLNDPFYQHYWK